MGIEIATLAAYASIASAAVGAASFLSGGSKPKQAPAAPAPEKPPQAAKAPDVAAVREKNVNAAAGGPASTFLTGTGGVDPTTLNLGKSTLFGQ